MSGLKQYALAVGSLTLPAALAGLLAGTPAEATTTISSAAYALGVDVNLAGTPLLLGALVTAFDSSSSPYSITNSLSSYGISGLLTTGALGASAMSLNPSTPFGGASSGVNDLYIVAIDPSILTITATTITSTSSVAGVPTPTAMGTTTITNLTISGAVIGSPITLTGTFDPPANSLIFESDGLEIILNQQTPDPSETAGITTNAIVLEFNGFPFGLNAVNGGIDVAGSYASIDVVPEPATWAEMLAGFTVVGFLMRGRLKAKAVV